MIIGVLDKSKSKTLIGEQEVIYRLEHQYAYGIPQEYRVGIKFDKETLEVGKEYALVFKDRSSVQFYLYRKINENIGDEKISIYCFVAPIFEKLVTNKLPNDYSLLGVDFKTYIQSNNNQLKYFSFGLKKKGMMLTNNENKEPKQIHTTKALSGDSIGIEPTDIREINDYGEKRRNYYTVQENAATDKTSNGISKAQFLPRATKEDILGLDTYLLPKYELWGDFVSVNIGAKISVKGESCVVLEKEVFFYKKKHVYFLVAGVKS